MKKVLSILLSVMMVAGLFAALIPTASAATITPPTVTKGELVMSQNFDAKSLASLTNADLVEALGWKYQNTATGADGYRTTDRAFDANVSYSIVDGMMRLESTSPADNVHLTFASDERLGGGDYIIEYDVVYNTATTGDNGRSFGPMAGSTRSSKTENRLFWMCGIKSRGNIDNWVSFPNVGGGADVSDGGSDLASGTASTTAGETTGHMASVTATDSLRLRFIVDAEYGISVWTLDKTTGAATKVSAMESQQTIKAFRAHSHTISKDLAFRLLSGVDTKNLVVSIDNLSVWTIDRTGYTPIVDNDFDGLVVSSVSSDAVPEFKTTATTTMDVVTGNTATGEVTTEEDGYNYKYEPDGTPDYVRAEYIEVYNASTEAKNIYDYAIAKYDGYGTTWKRKLSACSTISVLPGAQTVKSANNTAGYTYHNPAYEDAEALIQPGETAVLLIPNNWWNATGCAMSPSIFRKIYLQDKLGYSEDEAAAVKILTLAPQGSGWGLNNSGNLLLGLVKKENGAIPSSYSDKYLHDVAESVCFNIRSDNQYMFANHVKSAISSYKAANYTYWDANGNYILGGVLANTRSLETTTPGTVALKNRRPFTVTYVVDGEVYTTESAYLKTEYSLITSIPTKEGYAITGWVDSEGNPVTKVAAADVTEDMTFYTTTVYTGPVTSMIGTQSTYLKDSGKYDLRVIARIGAVLDLSQIKNVHFELSMAPTESDTFTTRNVYLEYVYRSLSTNFGNDSLAAQDGTYYVTLQINNCPENITYKIKPVITMADGTVIEGTTETYNPMGLRQNIEYMQFSFDDGYKCFQNLTNNTYNSLFDEPFFGWMKDMHDEYGAVFSVYVFNSEFKAFADSEKGALYADEFQANKSWLRLGLHSPANDQSINFNVEGYNTYEVGYNEWTSFLTSAMIVTGNDPDCIDKFHRLHNFAGSDAAISGMIQAGIDFAATTEDTTDTAEDYRPAGFYAADDTRDSYYLSSELSQWLNANNHVNDTGKDLTLVATDIRAEYFNTNPTKFAGADMYEELFLRHTSKDYTVSASSMIVFSHENRIQNNTDLVMDSMELACKFAQDYGITFAFSDAVDYEATDHDINTPIASRPVIDDDTNSDAGSGLGSNEDVGVELPEIKV